MGPRIERLKTELERLEETVEHCHPDMHEELQALIDDMRAHVTELENAMAKIDEEPI